MNGGHSGERMDPEHGRMKMNVEVDRLSSLSDDLIHNILSFIDTTEAIDTSVLSSRWRFIWTSMPYLNFSSEDFSTLPEFSKFVTDVLSHRNNLIDVYSLKLKFRGKATQVFVKRIIDYAFSHNIQQLDVVWLPDHRIKFPFHLPSSQSLKHLSFTMQLSISQSRMYNRHSFTQTLTWEFPALTTLDLRYVTLCDDEADQHIGFFSKCVNLRNLTLKEFKKIGYNAFSIFLPQLSNLTLENSSSMGVVNVAAPELKNLTIRSCQEEHVIFAPNLASLIYEGFDSLRLSTEGFLSLEKADICVSWKRADAHQIFCLLEKLHSVCFLTLNMELVENISSSVDLILQQPSPFVNLKSLSIYPKYVSSWEQTPKNVMSTKLKSYLLDGSAESTFTMVFCEEIKAQRLIAELRVLLDKEKDHSIYNKTHLARGKTPAESHERKKLKTGGSMAHIKSCWEDLVVQIQAQKEKACLIISKLQEIEELLTKLPASKAAKIQPCFSSLCLEADIVTSQITSCMKMQCDENQSLSSVRFLVPLFQS